MNVKKSLESRIRGWLPQAPNTIKTPAIDFQSLQLQRENKKGLVLESSKNLASIGAILQFLILIPIVGIAVLIADFSIGAILLCLSFLPIVGLILAFLGMKGLSEHYEDPSIYKNALQGLISSIIALVALTAIVTLAFAFHTFTFGLGTLPIGVAAVAVILVPFVIAEMYFRRAFSTLAQKSGDHRFETAGFLLLTGAILTIVFGIGLLLMFIGWIYATRGFFSIKVPSA